MSTAQHARNDAPRRVPQVEPSGSIGQPRAKCCAFAHVIGPEIFAWVEVSHSDEVGRTREIDENAARQRRKVGNMRKDFGLACPHRKRPPQAFATLALQNLSAFPPQRPTPLRVILHVRKGALRPPSARDHGDPVLYANMAKPPAHHVLAFSICDFQQGSCCHGTEVGLCVLCLCGHVHAHVLRVCG